MDQKFGQGSIVIAAGYVTNAREGPPVATVATGRPVLSAIKPTTENTTNPANILVLQLIIGTNIESLKSDNILRKAVGLWIAHNNQERKKNQREIVIFEFVEAGHTDDSTPSRPKRVEYLYRCIGPHLN